MELRENAKIFTNELLMDLIVEKKFNIRRTLKDDDEIELVETALCIVHEFFHDILDIMEPEEFCETFRTHDTDIISFLFNHTVEYDDIFNRTFYPCAKSLGDGVYAYSESEINVLTDEEKDAYDAFLTECERRVDEKLESGKYDEKKGGK